MLRKCYKSNLCFLLLAFSIFEKVRIFLIKPDYQLSFKKFFNNHSCRYTGKASNVYLYYTPESKFWNQGVSARIEP